MRVSFQKVDNCLKFMCDVIKVHAHHTHPECWVITDEMEEIEIDSIGDIVSAPFSFKKTNGELIRLTEQVLSIFYWFSIVNLSIRIHPINYFSPSNISVPLVKNLLIFIFRKLLCIKLLTPQNFWLAASRR